MTVTQKLRVLACRALRLPLSDGLRCATGDHDWESSDDGGYSTPINSTGRRYVCARRRCPASRSF